MNSEFCVEGSYLPHKGASALCGVGAPKLLQRKIEVEQATVAKEQATAKKQTATARERGIVKWFRNSYGFITRNDGTQVFAHEKAIVMDGFRTLHDGQQVEYEVESSPKGPKAVRIKPLD